MARKAIKKINTSKEIKVKQKKNDFIHELVRQKYHLANTFAKLKMSPKTYYMWLSDDKEFKGIIEKLRDQEIDVMEDAHRDLVKERNPQAVIFGLKTRGAKRGWQEKQVVETKNFNVTAIKILEPGEEIVNNDEPDSD